MNRLKAYKTGSHGHEITTLFTARDFVISGYRCCGKDTPDGSEEVSRSFDIVLPRFGLYVWKLGRRELTSSVNHVSLFQPDQGYRVSHPVSGCDAGTVISLRRAVVPGLFGDFEPSKADDDFSKLRFPVPQAPADPAVALMHHRLLGLLHCSTHDVLAIEEVTTSLCRVILAAAYVVGGRGLPAKHEISQRSYRERVELVKGYLAAHAAEPVSLGELSRVAAVSPFHLSRIFTAAVGVPVHRYLTRFRLNTALEQIQEGAENLTQVALDTGFSSHSHFSAAFRAEFGLSPSQFRRELPGRGRNKGELLPQRQ